MTSGSPVSVEALLSGRQAPSSRFRVLQHVAPLRSLGVQVCARPPRISKYASLPHRWERSRLRPPARVALRAAKLAVRLPAVARSWRADLTWLERGILPGRVTLEPLLGRPMLFDVDDAIWLPSHDHEHAARETARRAACVLAGNDFLADWFSAFAPVERIWTAVDTERFVPRTDPQVDRECPFIVGWTGTISNLPYLQAIEPAIARFLDEAPDAKLKVMADFPPDLHDLPAAQLDFVRWNAAHEAAVIASFDVGLMPLPDSDWARGKCAFKMLQYLACGVPAVVSSVGMNKQVLAMGDVGLGVSSLDEWVEALRTLHAERDRARALGRSGRDLVERSFSVGVITPQLAAAMKRVL